MKSFLVGIGIVSLALGVLGIFLPLLPTTPFVLLSAWCFARSSERFHRWLIAHSHLGPIIESWERDRTIPRQAKRMIVLLILISISVTAALWLGSRSSQAEEIIDSRERGSFPRQSGP